MIYTQKCDLREIYAGCVSYCLEALLGRKGEFINLRDDPVIRIHDFGFHNGCQVQVTRSQISGLEGKAWINIYGIEEKVNEVVKELREYFQRQPNYTVEWLHPLN